MDYKYQTSGTCSREIYFSIEDGIIKNVNFIGGCNGNLKGIASLVEGQNAAEVMDRVKGITCGSKSTSCPDQLANAIKLALEA